MEIVRNVSLFTTVILVGLSAGFFYAWEVSVIPGTIKVSTSTYLETMQQINREIINPKFFIGFFGSLVFLVLSTYLQFNDSNNGSFAILFAATSIYLIGTVGVTGLGNVPLNDMLDAIQLESLNPKQLEDLRLSYELKWNRLHTIRTLFSGLSFSLTVLAVFVTQKTSEINIQSIL